MFRSRYFGSRYFASRYWGGSGGGGPIVDLAERIYMVRYIQRSQAVALTIQQTNPAVRHITRSRRFAAER